MIEPSRESGHLAVALPAGWNVLGVFSPKVLPPADEVDGLCRAALASPRRTASFAERDLRGKRILVVADDVSKPTPVSLYFRPVRDALVAAGAQRGVVEIRCTLGVPRPMTEAKAAAKVGAADLDDHRGHNHNACAPTDLVHVGATKCGTPRWFTRPLALGDLVVTLGVIEPCTRGPASSVSLAAAG